MGVFGEGAGRHTVGADSKSESAGTWSCEVIVENRGTPAVPVEIELRWTEFKNRVRKFLIG